MADLGDVGTLGNIVKRNNGLVAPNYFRRISSVGPIIYSRGQRNNNEGDPAQPSLELVGRGFFRFRWTVVAGTREITIEVKQVINASPRPSLIVRANPSIGVNSDVEESAGSGTGWVTIGPATITPTSNGAVWVELHANYDAPESSYWDTLTVS